MTQWNDKGWPKNTRVRMSGDVKDEFKGKEAIIYSERYYEEETDSFSYHVYHNGDKYHVPEKHLEFVAYPTKLMNIVRTNVYRLIEGTDEIKYQLYLEQQLGEMK